MTKNELIDFNALLAKIYKLTAERNALRVLVDAHDALRETGV